MPRDLIKMVSEGKLEDSRPTGTFYTTSKNKRTSTEKLRMKRYDSRIRKHVMFKEEKIK
jgi:large subunit ribosomal protein L33